MRKNVSKKSSFSIPTTTVFLIAAGGMLSGIWLNAGAQQQRTAAHRSVEAPTPARIPADLERAFWVCDYAGTMGGVDAGTAMACSTITEELKLTKFNGDFESLVGWWRENKPAQHEALAAARQAESSTAALNAR